MSQGSDGPERGAALFMTNSARWRNSMRHGSKVATSKLVRGTILSAAVASLGIFALQAKATDVSWNGVSGNWTDSTNWTPGQVPLATDNAIFNLTGVNSGPEIIYLN